MIKTMKSALKLKDFKDAIWSRSGTSGEVVGIVGFCVVLTQDKEQLPKSIEKKYRRYVLVMTDGHSIDEIKWDSLQQHYEGNVIRWATERQRRFHRDTQEQLKRLNAQLRKFRARARAAKPGLEDIERLTKVYPKKKKMVWGREEWV